MIGNYYQDNARLFLPSFLMQVDGHEVQFELIIIVFINRRLAILDITSNCNSRCRRIDGLMLKLTLSIRFGKRQFTQVAYEV